MSKRDDESWMTMIGTDTESVYVVCKYTTRENKDMKERREIWSVKLLHSLSYMFCILFFFRRQLHFELHWRHINVE